MPKQTFLNLPEEKRETIINAAVEEFAQYGLENASTNRIVKNSGIAKGSFYQYFEDKQDVFMYLLSTIEREEMEFFKGKHPPSSNMDTFHYFRWMVKTGMEFGLAHPRAIQAAWRVLLGEGLYYGKNFSEYRQKTTQALTTMIKHAIERGEVDQSVNVKLAVMIMETWSNAITTYVLNEGMKQKDMLKWMRSPKTQETIDKLLYVMEYGLRKTESKFKTSS
ncbi:MAG: TetR/AcrR family transcriptional regulator [Chloroflexi bacterium]|nr:TetR/AcrR family transcriptional regulator [Chloroflexota bacterium]MBI1855150.1 TetR/AcrR family transcriptional regulator [Chloroflexota bacterium]MBI3341209.1 TetR/AcrR family transcriptional regulator [Chloroflexota bacterium]